MKNILVTYCRYNYWANKEIISLLKNNHQVLDKKVISSFPTIRTTIYHMWDAETIWLKRLDGESLSEWPSKNMDEMGIEFLKSWQKTSKAFIDWIENISDDELQKEIYYKTTSGKEMNQKAFEIIIHIMNHGTYHRGQLVTMLRNAGVWEGIPQTDLIAYYRQKL